jgi:hypothetical protein
MNIKTTSEKSRFENHLALSSNNRLIFSGIFGIGKTTFLKEYFSENEKFECFTLSPVNYSISNNEDILEYIKYDLIFELLSKNVEYKVEKFPIELTSQFYIHENFVEIFASIAKYCGKIGKTVSDIALDLKKLKNDIEKHKEKYQIDEKQELIDFLTEISDRPGSIFEENHITLLISNLIETLKKEEKETILIIDDLDRLDPEHIFRILNVFACHFDIDSTTNKFGIEKIILVCDIENIRNIFNSKYGQKTDFSGYIDKFFSNEIFFFNSKKEISETLENILYSINFEPQDNNYFNLKVRDYTTTKLLIIILKDLIHCDAINLRTLLRLTGKLYEIKSYHFSITHAYQNRAYNQSFGIVMIFDFLSSIYGSKENLKQGIEKLVLNNKNKFIEKDEYYKYESIITFIDYPNNKLKTEKHQYINTKLDLIIDYEIARNGFNIQAQISEIKGNNDGLLKEYFPYADLLMIAFPLYKNLEIIN